MSFIIMVNFISCEFSDKAKTGNAQQTLFSQELCYGKTTLKASRLRESYELIAEAVLSGEGKVILPKLELQELSQIMLCVKRDHPQISWLQEEYSYQFTHAGSQMYLHLKYTKTPEQIQRETTEVESAAKAFLTGISSELPEFDRALLVHDRICERLSYSANATGRETLYGALCENLASCQGYAKTYQYLLNLAGIECLIVYGTASEEAHAWNMVRLNGEYALVDTTWDDALLSDKSSYLSHDYLFMDGKSFSLTHTPYEDERNYVLPTAPATRYNYFVFTQTQALSDDEATLKAVLEAAFDRSLAYGYQAVQISFFPIGISDSITSAPNGFRQIDQLSKEAAAKREKEVTGRHFNAKTGVLTYFIRNSDG